MTSGKNGLPSQPKHSESWDDIKLCSSLNSNRSRVDTSKVQHMLKLLRTSLNVLLMTPRSTIHYQDPEGVVNRHPLASKGLFIDTP